VCPEPALLVAYLDGTLFHRDAAAVDLHVETCAECTALLHAMRQTRAAEQAAKTSRRRIMVGAALVFITIAGYGVWVLLPRDAGEPVGETTETTTPAPAPIAPTPAPAPTIASPPRARAVAKAPAPKPTPKPVATARAQPLPAKPAPPRVMWRTRDLRVESSADGGTTWVTDHTADRPIRASAFVDANVAWIVGDSGLILRRTKNGWFGASPPADGHITAVKASSPSKATVTLDDGRVFTTANGGVSWSPVP
jgi:hypothetical protein